MQYRRNSQVLEIQSSASDPKTLKDVYARFAESREFRKLKPNSQASYEYLSQYIAVDLRLNGIDEAKINARILAPLKDRPGLYTRARSSTLRLLRFAAQNRWLSHAVTHDKDPTITLGRVLRWEPQRVIDVLLSIEDDPELRLWVAVMYYTALRGVDVKPLRPDAIVQMGQTMHFAVKQQKTGKMVYPQIGWELCLCLAPYMAEPAQLLFKSTEKTLRRRLQIATREIGLKKHTGHGLRKAAVCEAAEGGATLPELMAQGGWKSPQTAAIYFEQADQGRLAAAANSKRRPF